MYSQILLCSSYENEIIPYTSRYEDYIRKDTESPFWLVNTNKLIGKIDGIYGLKTGHTSFAVYCITLYMKKENISLISVVFGYDTAAKRNAESLELLR
jgi:D-alanyl-D-alanine carboxypeptidase (penicillin-binding protein 5/6)